MPREKESYRDNVERIMAAFPNKEVIKPTELANWLGLDVRTVYKYFPIKKGIGISVAVLARCLS